MFSQKFQEMRAIGPYIRRPTLDFGKDTRVEIVDIERRAGG